MTPAFKKISAIALILFAAGIFLSTLSSVGFGMQDELTDSGLVPPGVSLTGEEKELAAPARIRIPSIGVDAFVQDVGIGKSGNMAVPTNYDDVGWYRYGPAPGEKGSAVIDGHVDNGFGLPAVFSRLSELEAGDDIYIDTEDGKTIRFVVEESAVYSVAGVPLQRIFNRNDTSRLNLITCRGTWLPEDKMYDERLVVYAVRAD